MSQEKQKQLKTILKLLEKSKISEEGYESSEQPFFMNGKSTDFKINYKYVPDVPDSLNRHFKMFYQEKLSGFLFIPYILWLFFASYLNLFIVLNN